MVSLVASDTVARTFLPCRVPMHQMKRCAHFRARLHPRTTLAKLRKSWNGSGEVPVVQGLRGDIEGPVLSLAESYRVLGVRTGSLSRGGLIATADDAGQNCDRYGIPGAATASGVFFVEIS